MPREISAGVVAYRRNGGVAQILLVHPGGPYWARKDEAAWSIPKGLVEAGEASWDAARREFEEELGQAIRGPAEPLPSCPTPGGKLIVAWMVEADLDLAEIRSNRFEMEWPPRSGRLVSFPEVDRAGYFDAATALMKIHKGQRPLLAEAFARLASRSPGSSRS
jgi:predicted NUDIX family NTP pyrophosphohydrolase